MSKSNLIEELYLVFSCPLLLDLDLKPFIQQLVRLDLRGLAIGVTLLLPDDSQRDSSLRLLLGGETNRHLVTLAQLAQWREEGRSVPLVRQVCMGDIMHQDKNAH